MVVLVTCKNEEDPIKNEALEWSQQCYIIHQFLRCSRAANSLIGDGILTKFKLIWAFIVANSLIGDGILTKFKLIWAFIVVLICKNEYDLFKSGLNISPIISLWGFF